MRSGTEFLSQFLRLFLPSLSKHFPRSHYAGSKYRHVCYFPAKLAYYSIVFLKSWLTIGLYCENIGSQHILVANMYILKEVQRCETSVNR